MQLISTVNLVQNMLLLNMTFYYNLLLARPRGRPRKTWRQIVERDCGARGLSGGDAMGRAGWRGLIGMIDDYDESSG